MSETGFEVVFAGLSAGLLRANVGVGEVSAGADEGDSDCDTTESERELLRRWWI